MRTLGTGIAVVVALLTRNAAAQSPPNAATVLANVQQFYANANQFTSPFLQTVTNATFNTSKTSEGELWVLKPADFRWDYRAKRNGHVTVTRSFIFDGKTVWAIDHQSRQIIQNQVQPSALPVAISFLTGASALSSQFSVALNTSGKYGPQGAVVLELAPNQPSAPFKQLLFVVDPSDWHVTESIVIDTSGNSNYFSFLSPDLTSTVKASWFQVDPSSVPTYRLVQVNQTGPAASSGSTVATPKASAGPATSPAHTP